jgi:hypothetical protein
MNSTTYDVLSDLGRELLQLNEATAYGRLVVSGDGDPAAAAKLKTVSAAQLLKDKINRPPFAQLLLAGLWLWHDWLDESHRISQQIETSDGSYWHAIMHRREGDFSNSKYWLARCRAHPTHADIAARLPGIIAAHATDPEVKGLTAGGWDPFAFVDLAEKLHDRPHDPLHSTAVAVQRLEWQALFEHCARQAIG